ncbi:hypothetical protein BsWGS_00355 [Bradybaena similaris]
MAGQENRLVRASAGTSSEIKSSAVVKYSSVKFPVQFSTIRLNTDLNYPPSGRLQAGFYMFQDQHMHNNAPRFSQFLSVNMADTYQDLVGKVDVMSSSKNIKALLKMPYSESPTVSIIVHRLRKTLLLEEFDVHKHLLKKEAEEWSWLKSYYNNVIAKGQEDKSKCIVSANTRRDSFTEKIYMNLIRHSFAASVEVSECTALETAENRSKHIESVLEAPEDLKGFHHETLWEFEDISMLIDSDLPIFGSGETRRPCISLRLRDARSPPINVLTGLDYWLDNLMSNVPEVAMCYHVNGFVQKYEVMRTEDIPNLENSSFDPNEVLDIAQNIMSFIKRQAAVEGHTYWLYKSENDDMVKLYDLTDYCKNEISEGDNPFTVPVGLLCHRVGRNLIRTNQRRTADVRAMFENCVRLLDENKHAQVCAEAHFHLSDLWVPDKSVNDVWQEKGKISDPPSDLYDEDEASSDDSACQEQQTDTDEYVQDDPSTNMKSLKLEEERSASEKYRDRAQSVNAVAMKELFVRGMIKRKAWNVVQVCHIAGSTDERCKIALSHIRKGLNCVDKDQSKSKNIGLVETQRTCSPSKAIPLHYAPLNKKRGDRDEKPKEQECLQRCNPFTPIPLHYASLQKSKGDSVYGASPDTSEDSGAGKISPVSEPDRSGFSTDYGINEGFAGCASNTDDENVSKSWHFEAKFQLLKKAAITYFVLAKEFYEIKKYGHTLRHLRYAVHCYEAMQLLKVNCKEESQDKELFLLLLYLAAKARFSMHTNWHSCHKDFEELGEEEAAILHSAQSVVSTPKSAWIYDWPNNQESNLLAANEAYQQAFKLPIVDKKPQSFRLLMKKNHAACIMTLGYTQLEICKDKVYKKDSFATIKPVWDKSLVNFQKAIKMFEGFGDKNTAAHNCVNVAYLYVLAAAAVVNDSPSDLFPAQEKEYLSKVVEWYEKGLIKYERGEKMDVYRETIHHNMRMHYQQMAQRYFTLPTEKITEQDLRCMKDLLQKSLSYCFTDTSEKHLKKSQICAANNHLNLARVFDVEAASCTSPSRQKNLRQKMEESFQASFKIYTQIKWRRSQMCCKYLWIEALLNKTETKLLSSQAKQRLIHSVFLHLCDLHPVLVALKEGDYDSNDNTTVHSTDISAVKQLLSTFNAACCSLLKLDKSNTGVKHLYGRSLRLTTMTEIEDLLHPLINILTDLKHLLTSDLAHS